jgi:hypothetical protein
MARGKSTGPRAGMGGPKAKAAKGWVGQASSFFKRHLSVGTPPSVTTGAFAPALDLPPPPGLPPPALPPPALPSPGLPSASDAGQSAEAVLSPNTNDSLLTSPPPNRSAALNNEGSGDSSSEDEPLTRRLPTKKLSTQVEQPAAPAWQAGFMEKVNALRKHLRWLAHTVFPVEKQAGLAASLGMSPSSLSTFLTGNRKCGGEMSVQQLDHARRDMQRRLVAARLPGTMPDVEPLTQATVSQFGCGDTLSPSPPTPPTTTSPLLANPRPSVAILTVDLAEAPGCEGGVVLFTDLGSAVEDLRWRVKADGVTLFLRNGLRGLRTLGRQQRRQ